MRQKYVAKVDMKIIVNDLEYEESKIFEFEDDWEMSKNKGYYIEN